MGGAEAPTLGATTDVLIYTKEKGIQPSSISLNNARAGARAITIQSRNPVVQEANDYSGIYIIGGYSARSGTSMTWPNDSPAGEYFNWKNNRTIW